MSYHSASQSSEKKKYKPETTSGNMKESEGKKELSILELNKILGEVKEINKVPTFSKEQAPKKSIKDIEEPELPVNKPSANQNVKDNQSIVSSYPNTKSKMNKLSKDHTSKASSSGSMGHSTKKISKDTSKKETIEEDDSEVETKDQQMKNRLRSSTQIEGETQKYKPSKLESKVIYRGISLTETSLRVSE